MNKRPTSIPFALLINDIHASKDDIPGFMTNWKEALSICRERCIHRIIIGGDLWQSRSAQTLSTILAVKQALVEAIQDGISVVIAEGNHDKVDQDALDGYSHVFSGYANIDIVDDFAIYEMTEDDSSVDLYVMSYFPENGSFTARYEEMVKELVNDRKSILYIHQGIRGGLSMPSEDELPANMFKQFDRVLVGHYHDRKVVAGTNIEYIGASRQHNFGEDEEKGYTVLYPDGSYEFVKNKANVRYKVIEVGVEDMDDEFFQRLQSLQAEGYKVKTRVKCQSQQASSVNKQKLAESGATKVELVTEQTTANTVTPQDLSKKYDKSGIKQEYINFCSDKDIDNVELGLTYLNKITSDVATD